ncbi:hypothetical protein FRC10_011357 [Ceratobasidium sp. 414]|nr:hypothetical protein FRC10_011357 [Ceratobasidium sp. 414]
MAALDSFARRAIDDDAISVASDCTLPDPIHFGAPLERMTLNDAYTYDSASVKSYASSYYPSCDYLPASSCQDPECDCESDDDDAELDHPVIFDDDDEDHGLSPCASSTSSLSDHFQQPRRLSNAGDLAGVEHCDTPKVMRKLSNAFGPEDALPPRPESPLDHVAVRTQQRIGTSDAHRHQLALARFLNAEPVRSDPWNHTVPVVHIREHTIANRTTGATLVIERFHDWWSVPFANVRDCIDYTKQVLEGVAFLHENQITNLAEAVRPHNIQMDTGLAPVAPVLPSTSSLRKSASAPVTPSTESEELPAVAWSRGDFPVRYYFTATSGLHRVRRLRKGGTRVDLGDDLEGSSMVHVTDDDEEEEEEESAVRLRELDALSREVDDDMWETSVAVDLVAVGHSLDLVFGKMPFNHLRPMIQDLRDAFETGVSADDVLTRVEDLERALPSHELLRPISFD